MQIRGDAMVRGQLFQQQRIENLFDTNIDRAHKIVRTLITQGRVSYHDPLFIQPVVHMVCPRPFLLREVRAERSTVERLTRPFSGCGPCRPPTQLFKPQPDAVDCLAKSGLAALQTGKYTHG
jgi:hypothetical protein